MQFRHYRDKRLSYYTKSGNLISFKIVHQIKYHILRINEINLILAMSKKLEEQWAHLVLVDDCEALAWFCIHM